MKRRANGNGTIVERKRKDGTTAYLLKFYKNGTQVYRNANAANRAEAEQKLAEIVAGVAKGISIATRQLTLGEAIQNVKITNESNKKRTETTYDSLITPTYEDGKPRPHFDPRTKMTAITTQRIREYIVARQKAKRGKSNATINRHLAALSRAFSLAIEEGLLHAKPHIPKLKEAAPRSGFFERAEYEAVRDALPEHLGHVVTFAYITGWRLGEILDLEWRNVDFDRGEVRIDPGRTKNGDGRVIKMTRELRAVLQERKKVRAQTAKKKDGKLSPYVFTRKNGSRIGSKKPAGAPVAEKRNATGRHGSFRKWWRRACRKAGCEGRLFHDLRRSAVRNFVRHGIPERVAMAMTGHVTRSVFERYNIVSDGDLADAARKLDAVL